MQNDNYNEDKGISIGKELLNGSIIILWVNLLMTYIYVKWLGSNYNMTPNQVMKEIATKLPLFSIISTVIVDLGNRIMLSIFKKKELYDKAYAEAYMNAAADVEAQSKEKIERLESRVNELEQIIEKQNGNGNSQSHNNDL